MPHPQKIAVKLGRSFDGAGMDAVSLLGVGAMNCCDGTGLCSGGSLGVERVQRLGVDLHDQERNQEKGLKHELVSYPVLRCCSLGASFVASDHTVHWCNTGLG